MIKRLAVLFFVLLVITHWVATLQNHRMTTVITTSLAGGLCMIRTTDPVVVKKLNIKSQKTGMSMCFLLIARKERRIIFQLFNI